jgi:hypothetical protein
MRTDNALGVRGRRIARRLLVVVVATAVAAPVFFLTPGPRTQDAAAVGTVALHERVFERHDEGAYLERVTALLDEAIAARVNLDRTLRARRSAAEYERALEQFRSQQLAFAITLGRLDVPPRLIPFHERLLAASTEQVRFYAAFVAAKTRDADLEIGTMIDHPALRASRGDLRAAWDHVSRLYPALDRQVEAVIEGRLTWFDVI